MTSKLSRTEKELVLNLIKEVDSKKIDVSALGQITLYCVYTILSKSEGKYQCVKNSTKQELFIDKALGLKTYTITEGNTVYRLYEGGDGVDLQYSKTVTDANGCVKSESYQYSFFDADLINYENFPLRCNNDTSSSPDFS